MTSALMTSAANAPTYVPFGARPSPGGTAAPVATSSAAVVEPANVAALPFPVGTPPGADPRASRPTALWLIGAFAATLFATGISIAGRLIDRAANAAGAALLDADADRLATALDASMRAARLRANAIAATPVLRTAIDTNAATMKDLAEREYVFSVAAGETLEIFQTRNGNATSLLRLPATGPQLQPLTGAAARIQLVGGQLLAIAGAPISTNAGVRGSLAVATHVDLVPATRLLAQHALDASLRGRELDLGLIDPRDPPPEARPVAPPATPRGSLRGVARTLPLPLTGELTAAELALVATPVATITTWVAPARLAALAVAVLLVLCYLVSFRRIRAAR
jgi:hypothetical protein